MQNIINMNKCTNITENRVPQNITECDIINNDNEVITLQQVC